MDINRIKGNIFFPISITHRFYRYIHILGVTHLDVRYRFVSTYYANIYVFISTLYLYSCVIFHLVGFLYSILQDISFSMKGIMVNLSIIIQYTGYILIRLHKQNKLLKAFDHWRIMLLFWYNKSVSSLKMKPFKILIVQMISFTKRFEWKHLVNSNVEKRCFYVVFFFTFYR